jgi:hypothetical protein
MLADRRDDMTLPELLEELEVSHPEEVAAFERRHPEAMEAVAENGFESSDDTEDPELADALADLADDLRTRLRI